MIHYAPIAPDAVREMREWIYDCNFSDIDVIDDLSDGEVIDGIRRHYDGGIPAFLDSL